MVSGAKTVADLPFANVCFWDKTTEQWYRAAPAYLYELSSIRPPYALASTGRQQTVDESKPVTDADRDRRIIEVVVRIMELA